MSERWLSLAEIAAYLSVSRDSVYRWVEDRGMPAQKIGRQWKLKSDDVDAWVRSGQADIMGQQQTGSSQPRQRQLGALIAHDDKLLEDHQAFAVRARTPRA